MLSSCNYPHNRISFKDHRWNRTTIGDNTVIGLVTITVLIQGIAMTYANFFAFPGRPEITSDQQNPGVPPAD